MKVNTYLMFNGTCRQAIDFYTEVFDAPDAQVMLFEDMPPDPAFPLTEEAKKLVMHAELQVGEDLIYLCDNAPGMQFDAAMGDVISVTIGKVDAAAATEVYNRLLPGGTVIMPLEETFWSPAYGAVLDKFGVKWQVSAEK